MTDVILLGVWLAVSVFSVKRLEKSLRVFILDYEIKRPKILQTISIGIVWIVVSIVIMQLVL